MLDKSIRSSAIRGVLVGLLSVAAAACGDDEDKGDTDAGPRAGNGGGGAPRAGTGGSTAPAIDPLPPETAGKACSDDGDCGSSGTCLANLPGAFGMGVIPAPGGYCTGECLTDMDCGEGGTCTGAISNIPGIAPIRGQCLAGCDGNDDCRDGYRCVNALGMPQTGAADAGVVDPTGGLLGANSCQPRPETDQLPNGVVGSACTEDANCDDGRCMTMSTLTAFPGGYCTGRCLEDAECGADGVCTAGALGGVGTCYLGCASDADCDRDGYRCRAAQGTGIMRCVPGAAPLPDNTAGKACAGDADCGGGAMTCATMLGQRAAPGGYCSTSCVNNADCGAGGVCSGQTCYKPCADTNECREGYTCGRAGRFGQGSMTNVCGVTPPPSDEDAGI